MTKMKCEKIQELILTDYADGELWVESQIEIADHIRACAACRELDAAIRQKIRPHLKGLIKEEPPAYILERVKQAITSGPIKHIDIFADIRKMIAHIFVRITNIPRPVVAFAATAMIIVAVMISRPIAEKHTVDQYLDEQISFIAALDTV